MIQYVVIGAIAWIYYRRKQGLPILPSFVSNPFANGAVLVKSESGVIAAVPAGTPTMHPVAAANSGLLSPQTAAAVQAVAAAAPTVAAPIASAMASTVATQTLTSGAWAMTDPYAGAGPDYFVDELGVPRSNSLASRPWYAR